MERDVGNGDERDKTYDRNDRRDETAPATKNSEDAYDKRQHRRGERDDVADEHPFAGRTVRVQAVLELFRKDLFGVRVVQAPDFDRVEPELALARGAEFDDFTTSRGVVPPVTGTVVPEMDGVEVFKVERRFRALEVFVESLVIDGGAGD